MSKSVVQHSACNQSKRYLGGAVLGAVLLTAALFPVARSSADSYVYHILPLGDSITHAEINRASYRYPLWKKLIDAGIKFDYVGSMDTQLDLFSKGETPQPDYKGMKFDKDHEGHFAWAAVDINKGADPHNKTGSGSLSQWTQKYDFDIALIHLGTNDAFLRIKTDLIMGELKKVIQTLRADNPNAVILLAQLIPAKRQPGDGKAVMDVNAAIPELAAEMNTEESPVILVDQFTGFDVNKDTYDGVHPNAQGEEKMAQRWFEAIQQALPKVKKRDGS